MYAHSLKMICQAGVVLQLVVGIPECAAVPFSAPDNPMHQIDDFLRESDEMGQHFESVYERGKRSSRGMKACEMLIAIDEQLYDHYNKNMTRVSEISIACLEALKS